MAFSPDEAAALMGFGGPSASGSGEPHFSRRADAEGKMEKTDDASTAGNAPSEPDVYTKRVPLDMYTRFLSHCRDLEFEEAVALSKAILRIDPRDKVIQQYIPVLQAHIELQEDEDEDEDDDEGDEDDDEDEEDDEDEDGNEEGDMNHYEGKESSAGFREGKESERAGASKQSRK
eukprot:g928.t1